MNTDKPPISLQSIYLRLLPITLPFVVILVGTVGLAIESQDYPKFGNVVLVLMGTTLTGLLPFSFVLGVFFLLADAMHPSKRSYYFAGSFLILLAAIKLAYELGRNLYF